MMETSELIRGASAFREDLRLNPNEAMPPCWSAEAFHSGGNVIMAVESGLLLACAAMGLYMTAKTQGSQIVQIIVVERATGRDMMNLEFTAHPICCMTCDSSRVRKYS